MVGQIDFDGVEEAVIDGSSEDITELEDSIEAELNNIFSEIGSDKQDVTFKIRVDKVLEGKGETAYCFSCLPSEMPIMDRIRDGFGSGKYQIRVWRTEPGKGARLVKKPMINILASKKPVPVVQDKSGDMSAILSAMAESQRMQMEQLKEIMIMNRPQTVAAPPQQSLTELVTALAGLQQLSPPPAADNGMTMFLKGVEMMKGFATESNGGEKGFADVLITAAKEFGGPIMEMSKNLAAMPGQPGRAVPGQPLPGEVMSGQPGQPGQPIPPAYTPDTTEDSTLIMLKMQVKNLVTKAAAGADPALYADLIIDNMAESQIREFLGQPNLKEFLTNLEPGVAQYWPWFETLQREVMAGLTDTGEIPGNESEPLTGVDTERDTDGEQITGEIEHPDAIESKTDAGDTSKNT